MNPIAVAEIVIVSVYLMLPFVPAANPFSDDFEWKFVNYAPIVTLGALLLLADLVEVSAKKWFTGPKHTIDQAVVGGLRHLTELRRAATSPGRAQSGRATSSSEPVEVRAVELGHREVVLLHPPGPEVEVDRADDGLDRRPQRPAVPRHQAEQPGAGDLVAQVLGRSSCRRAPRAARG